MKSITKFPKKSVTDFQKFRANNLSARSFMSRPTAPFFPERKLSFDRYDVDLTDSVLVQFERRIPPFSLRRRGRAIAPSDFRDRARAVTRWVGCFLSFAHNRRPNISQFSMGYSPH